MPQHPGAVMRLEETVSYQDGAIVSRKLAAGPGGNVTAFAFDVGEELSEHTTPHTAVLEVFDGRATVRIEPPRVFRRLRYVSAARGS